MSAKDAKTPRVFLIRHGETEWSQNGRYTGITDLPLLELGQERIRQTASVVFGFNRLIDPRNIVATFASPRRRAQHTLELLIERITDEETREVFESTVQTTEQIAEFGYGDYEGLKTHEIRALRHQRGLDRDTPWDIGRDGTEGPGGELPDQVAKRLDQLIDQIVSLQGEVLRSNANVLDGDTKGKGDILIVAHGHILRFFVKRWLGLPMDTKLELMLEPGGVCGLSYAHSSINERAVLVGMSFPGSA
ncbi:hypothetical protein, variant 1 [Exophiala mesophila]|nr:hypothetical protein, variant 1 [Exophiala mesophila]KIV92339.1 hypothetical protein, variant 1 [Exophiala mesophila]